MNLSIHLPDPLISKLDAHATAFAKNRSSYCHWPLRPSDRGHRAGTRVTLVTNNVREFARVPGLVVEDWLS